MKEKYEVPKVEIVVIAKEGIIFASGVPSSSGED